MKGNFVTKFLNQEASIVDVNHSAVLLSAIGMPCYKFNHLGRMTYAKQNTYLFIKKGSKGRV